MEEPLVALGGLLGLVDAAGYHLHVGQDELDVDDADVPQGVGGALHMDDVLVVKAAHHVHNAARTPGCWPGIVAQALPLGGALDQAGNVHELHHRGGGLLGVVHCGQRVQTVVGRPPCPRWGRCLDAAILMNPQVWVAHNWTEIRKFNLMFKTFQGVTEDAKNTVYLRPETAQGIFVNFQNVQRTTRRKFPFGVGQVGKSFRNEITPGNFIFRIREFEQMELEFFCQPGTDLDWFHYWKDYCRKWLLDLGMNDENLRLRDHDPAELAFYSKATTDILSTCSPLGGASCGASPAGPTSTSRATRTPPART